MSSSAILASMLHSCSLLDLEEDISGKKKVRLVEKQCTDSVIEILHLPSDTFVLDLDKAFNTERLFHGKSGECKRADYLLISESAERVLFIEMKRSGSQANEIALQLRGALCAFEYCQIIAREFFQEREFLNHYQKRFIAILHTTGRKSQTAVSRNIESGSHCTPNNFLRISGRQTLQFRQLAH